MHGNNQSVKFDPLPHLALVTSFINALIDMSENYIVRGINAFMAIDAGKLAL